MPLNPAATGSNIEQIAYAALKAELSGDIPPKEMAGADKQWQAQARVLAKVAQAIITEILAQAQTAPGTAVATAGSPAAQTGSTVAPGKVI